MKSPILTKKKKKNVVVILIVLALIMISNRHQLEFDWIVRLKSVLNQKFCRRGYIDVKSTGEHNGVVNFSPRRVVFEKTAKQKKRLHFSPSSWNF